MLVSMGTTRTYGEGCAAAHALDLVGERWALLIVRELLLGPKRFTDLRAGVLHASPNVLSQRLRELEHAGVLCRRRLPPPAACWVYELTEWGHGLKPIVIALGQWGAQSPGLAPIEMSVDSHVLALGAMFHPELAGDMNASFELRLGEDRFHVEIADGKIAAARGTAEQPDATIATTPDVLGAVVFHGADLAAAVADGTFAIDGDADLVTRFVGLFPLPEPVELPRDPLVGAAQR